MSSMNDRAAEIDRMLAEQGFPNAMRRSDACRAIGVHHDTLRKLRKDGEITSISVRGQFVYRRVDVATFIALGEKGGGQ